MPRFGGTRIPPAPWQDPTRATGTAPPQSSPQTQQQAPTTESIQQVLRNSGFSGLAQFRFSIQNLGANVSATKLYRPVANASSVVGSQLSVPLPARGSVVGLTVSSSATLTGGTATFTIHINDSSTSGVEWSTGTTTFEAFSPEQYPFSQGDILDCKVTTANFSPTSADVEVTVYVVFTAET